jgi:hypothetical protein
VELVKLPPYSVWIHLLMRLKKMGFWGRWKVTIPKSREHLHYVLLAKSEQIYALWNLVLFFDRFARDVLDIKDDEIFKTALPVNTFIQLS